MKFPLAGVFIGISLACSAQTYVIEPDNYTDGMVLNQASPLVNLFTAGSDNLPIPPVSFDITAVTRTFPYLPPTGTKVFAHSGVPFFSPERRLRGDFDAPVSSLSILFQGTSGLVAQQGTLQGFDANGVLLNTYNTQPLLAGQFEAMSIDGPAGGISWFIAYTTTTTSPFGALDNFTFTVVPEPSMLAIVVGAAVCLPLLRRRSRS